MQQSRCASPRTVCGSDTWSIHHGPWAQRPLRVESTCAGGVQDRRWISSDASLHGTTSRGLEVGITHTASSPACGAARGVRRPPGSSRCE
eukprot:scaffold3370_cov64-Phaeocystis_antarctica.AAC.2